MESIYIVLPILYFSGLFLNLLLSLGFTWIATVRTAGADPISNEAIYILFLSIKAQWYAQDLILSSWATFPIIFECFVYEVVYPGDHDKDDQQSFIDTH